MLGSGVLVIMRRGSMLMGQGGSNEGGKDTGMLSPLPDFVLYHPKKY